MSLPFAFGGGGVVGITSSGGTVTITSPLVVTGSSSINGTEGSAPAAPAAGTVTFYPETNKGWANIRSDGTKRYMTVLSDDNSSAVTIPSGYRLYGQTNTGCGAPIYSFTGATQTGTSMVGSADVVMCGGGVTLSDWNVASGAFTHNFALSAKSYQTATNCASGASPAVCASAASGAVAVPTGTNPTLVVNTTAVTASSRIFLAVDETLSISATTCNTTLSSLVQPVITARTAGTSFTMQIGAVVASNPVCVSYFIVN